VTGETIYSDGRYRVGDQIQVGSEIRTVTAVEDGKISTEPADWLPKRYPDGRRRRDRKLAELFKAEARLSNQRRKLRLMQQNADRLIPTSGPGRRRAKAHRNQGLCLQPFGDGRCPRQAAPGSALCNVHDR